MNKSRFVLLWFVNVCGVHHIIHAHGFCCALLCYGYIMNYSWTHVIYLLIFSPVASSANGPLTRYLKLRVAHALQEKPLVSDPDMHHGTYVTHVLWCMSGTLTRSGGENVPGIPGAYATLKFAYLVRGQWGKYFIRIKMTRSNHN